MRKNICTFSASETLIPILEYLQKYYYYLVKSLSHENSIAKYQVSIIGPLYRVSYNAQRVKTFSSNDRRFVQFFFLLSVFLPQKNHIKVGFYIARNLAIQCCGAHKVLCHAVHCTLPAAEILSGKNARAWISMVLDLKR